MSAAAAGTVLVYVTAGDHETGHELAVRLVEERLVACVNVVPGVTSVYRWEGAVQRDEEVLLLAKTRADRAQAVCARVAELHAYDIPCAVVYPAAGGLPPYLDWLAEQASEG